MTCKLTLQFIKLHLIVAPNICVCVCGGGGYFLFLIFNLQYWMKRRRKTFSGMMSWSFWWWDFTMERFVPLICRLSELECLLSLLLFFKYNFYELLWVLYQIQDRVYGRVLKIMHKIWCYRCIKSEIKLAESWTKEVSTSCLLCFTFVIPT